MTDPSQVAIGEARQENDRSTHILPKHSRVFDPVSYGLDAGFRLTNFTDLKGCGCKVPRDQLLKLLQGLTESPSPNTSTPNTGDHESRSEVPSSNLRKLMHSRPAFGVNSVDSSSSSLPSIGIGLDSCLIPLRHAGLYLVQTTDFFYPLVDDPYIMGKIACANVLSDIYAMGVTECDNLLMILATSQKFTPHQRDVIMPILIQGFKDCAAEADSSVNGGQTVINPWVTIGGTASSVVRAEDVIMPENAEVGDVLVLTKPLGAQIAVNAHQWLSTNPQRAEKVRSTVSDDEVRRAYTQAMYNMARLNRNAAKLMHKYGAHAATDVTGFGIFGHADNLVKNQKNAVSFVITCLPIIANMAVISKMFPSFGLLEGRSSETSGGLLVCLSKDKATEYMAELKRLDGTPSWIIGTVEHGDRTVTIVDDFRVIEVTSAEDSQDFSSSECP